MTHRLPNDLTRAELNYLTSVTSDVQTQLNAKVATTSFAWTSYTPTWAATGGTPTLGNGTLAGAYMSIGNVCFFKATLDWGTTTSATSTTLWTISLPVALTGATANIFNAYITDASAGTITGTIGVPDTSTTTMVRTPAGGTVGNLLPMTWASGDKLAISGFYQI